MAIPKRSDGMPDYNTVTEFAKLNNITTLKDLEKLGNPISGDEYVLMTKLRCRLKKKGVERDGCSRNFFNYHVFVYHI